MKTYVPLTSLALIASMQRDVGGVLYRGTILTVTDLTIGFPKSLQKMKEATPKLSVEEMFLDGELM